MGISLNENRLHAYCSIFKLAYRHTANIISTAYRKPSCMLERFVAQQACIYAYGGHEP